MVSNRLGSEIRKRPKEEDISRHFTSKVKEWLFTSKGENSRLIQIQHEHMDKPWKISLRNEDKTWFN